MPTCISPYFHAPRNSCTLSFRLSFFPGAAPCGPTLDANFPCLSVPDTGWPLCLPLRPLYFPMHPLPVVTCLLSHPIACHSVVPRPAASPIFPTAIRIHRCCTLPSRLSCPARSLLLASCLLPSTTIYLCPALQCFGLEQGLHGFTCGMSAHAVTASGHEHDDAEAGCTWQLCT